MLTVTESAINKFLNTLNEHAKDTDGIIRLVLSGEKNNKLEFELDEQQEGDQVVETKEGRKVLLIEQRLSETLEGMILDYQGKPEGKGFAIYRVASES